MTFYHTTFLDMWPNRGIILWIFMYMCVFNFIANSAVQLHRQVESDVFWRNTEPVSIQLKDGLALCYNSSVSKLN